MAALSNKAEAHLLDWLIPASGQKQKLGSSVQSGFNGWVTQNPVNLVRKLLSRFWYSERTPMWCKCLNFRFGCRVIEIRIKKTILILIVLVVQIRTSKVKVTS